MKRALLGAICLSTMVGCASVSTTRPDILPPEEASIQTMTLSSVNDEIKFHRWVKDPRLYVLKFQDNLDQGEALYRAFRFMQERYGCTSCANQENSSEHMNGYMFVTGELARFFSEAPKDGIVFNDRESQLLKTMLESGLLTPSKRGFKAQKQTAVLSWSASAGPGTLAHEIGHGLYFLNPEYKEKVLKYWSGLPKARQEEFIGWLGSFGPCAYDVENGYTVRTEYQSNSVELIPGDCRPSKWSDHHQQDASLCSILIPYFKD